MQRRRGGGVHFVFVPLKLCSEAVHLHMETCYMSEWPVSVYHMTTVQCF